MESDELTGETDIGSHFKLEKTRKSVEENQKKLSNQGRKEKEKSVHNIFKENKYTGFFIKHKLWVFLIILILATLIPRLYFASVPITQDWAYGIAEEDIKNKINQQINIEYETLSKFKKNEVSKRLFEREIGKPEVKQEINKLAKQLKENFKDPSGNIYFYGADPYFYYQTISQENFNHKSPGLIYLGYFFNKIHKIISGDENLFASLSILPLLFTLVIILLFFFLVRQIINEYAAFFGALFLTLNPYFVSQTMFGLVDKQSMSLAFMLCIFLITTKIIEHYKQRRMLIFYSTLLVIAAWCFSKIWSGHFMIYALLLGGLTLYGIQKFIAKKSRRRILFTCAWAIPLILFLIFQGAIIEKAPTIIKTYLKQQTTSGYPDGYASIEELQSLSITDLITLTGGNITILLLLGGFFLLYLKKLEKNENSPSFFIFFFWLLAFMYLTLQTKRFYFFLLIPLSLFLGHGLVEVITFLKKGINSYAPVKKISFHLAVQLLIIIMVIIPTVFAFIPQYNEQKETLPIVDDALYQASLILKEQSSPDAKINTWWDKGHVANALTERKAYLNGAPQMPQLYWMARSLTTTDEIQSKNINQFLGCNLWSVLQFTERVNLTKEETEMFLMIPSLEEQKVFLEQKETPPDFINQLWSLLDCNPEVYFMITEDQLTIFNTMTNMANWDFEAAEAKEKIEGLGYAQTIDIFMQEGRTRKEAQELYERTQALTQIQDLGLRRSQCQTDPGQIQCVIQERYPFFVNRTTGEVLSQQKPRRIFIAENDEVIEYNYETYDYDNTLLIYNADGPTFGFLMPNEVADSMFIRMLFLEGKGLQHFEQVADVHRFGTKRTVVYKVLFD